MISDVTTVHRSWELHCPEPGPCEAIDGQVLVDGMCPGLCVRGNAEYFLFDCFFCCVEIGSAGQFSSAAKAREHHTCLASMVSQGLGSLLQVEGEHLCSARGKLQQHQLPITQGSGVSTVASRRHRCIDACSWLAATGISIHRGMRELELSQSKLPVKQRLMQSNLISTRRVLAAGRRRCL